MGCGLFRLFSWSYNPVSEKNIASINKVIDANQTSAVEAQTTVQKYTQDYHEKIKETSSKLQILEQQVQREVRQLAHIKKTKGNTSAAYVGSEAR